MRNASVVIGGVVALAVAWFPAPARAAPTDDTVVTFTVAAGSLDIVAPAGPMNLGSAAPGAIRTGQIGPITVTDTRGAADGSWVATVTSTDFTVAAKIIAAGEVDYWSGPDTAQAGAGVFTPGQAAAINALALDTAVPLTAFTHTGGAGGNTATWNPTLMINIPISAETGAYQATVTHSVA